MKLISLSESNDYHAAVSIVQCRNEWLLGLSTADDDRGGHWCMVGGGIKPGETAQSAAVRETKEEAGINCKAIGNIMTSRDKKGVAFIHCRATKKQKPFPNHEFSAMGWFSRSDMRSLKLYYNVRKLLNRV